VVDRRKRVTDVSLATAGGLFAVLAWRRWTLPLAGLVAGAVLIGLWVTGQLWVTALNFYWPARRA
jgi:hypothetical protein